MVYASPKVGIHYRRRSFFPIRIFNWQSTWTSDKLTIFFLPRELQEIISAPGWLVLAGFIAFETISLVTPFRAANFDHFAHLGGYFMGIVGAVAWKAERQKKLREEAPFLEKWLTPKWSPLSFFVLEFFRYALYSRWKLLLWLWERVFKYPIWEIKSVMISTLVKNNAYIKPERARVDVYYVL